MLKKMNVRFGRQTKTGKIGFSLFFLMVISMVLSASAFAITAPVAGDFAFNVYDIAVNNILQGPIGFVGGCFCVIMGVMLAMQQKIVPAVCGIICGAVLLSADTIVASMGMMF